MVMLTPASWIVVVVKWDNTWHSADMRPARGKYWVNDTRDGDAEHPFMVNGVFLISLVKFNIH